jgi:RNA polymerase sigma factor (sigma-70 family)
VQEHVVSEEISFRDLIRRVRARDPQAETDLVRLYEPAIRGVVRVQLTNAGVTNLVDSADICQSVMASFFVRMVAGQYDVEEPRKLLNLLLTMARNKATDQVKKLKRARRGPRPEAFGPANEPIDPRPSPSQLASYRELVQKLYAALSAEHQHLWDQRALDRPWQELAREANKTADALRMQFERAVKKAARQLGVEP